MALETGTRLGPYEILSLVGRGAMGEVFQARDTRLARTVALKVLPSNIASDPARRARFEREIQALSALTHPHICTLLDVGNDAGVRFLVMEYLEGETLAARLRRGPLPFPQALQTAIGIADALAAAHKQGIVHRDLKPGNVMLTKTGVKLLDFGLARLAHMPQLRTPPSKTTEPLTELGTVLGTRPYMAPEQLKGHEADARTDVWALGCVVYEALTGTRPFAGDNDANLIAAILHDEPPSLIARPVPLPLALEHVVSTCLAKDPNDRWQSASDIRRELQWIADGAHAAIGVPRVIRAQGRLRMWALAAAGLVIILLVARPSLLPWHRPSGVAPAGPTRFFIELPAERRLDLSSRSVAISPDGRTVAYAAIEGGRRAIFTRSLEDLEDYVVAGTSGGGSPFFSPDGRWLGFEADGTLKKVARPAGTPVTICESGTLQGAVWTRDDQIVFASGVPSSSGDRPVPAPVLRRGGEAPLGLYRVPAGGGRPELVARPDPARGELNYRSPALLPDGRTIAFSIHTGPTFDATSVGVVSIYGSAPRPLLPRATGVQFTPTGQLLFSSREGLMGLPSADPASSIAGRPVLLVEKMEALRGGPQFALSASGTLVYAEPRPAIVVPRRITRAGRVSGDWRLETDELNHVSLSPDGQLAQMTEESTAGMQLVMLDLRRGVLIRSPDVGTNHMAVWSPDRRHLAFSSDRVGAANLYLRRADGSGPVERLTSSPQHQDPGSFSPDARFLTYVEAHPTRQWDLWVLDLQTRRPQPLHVGPATECFPLLAPDGRTMVYVSDESGQREVYLERFPGGDDRVQVSTRGGDAPRWSPDGKHIYFFSGDTLFEVRVTVGPRLNAGTPQPLFRGSYLPFSGWGIPSYDVLPDGSGFLMLHVDRQEGQGTRLVVVERWFDELQAKLSTKAP